MGEGKSNLTKKEELSPEQLKGKAIYEAKPFQPRPLPSFKSVLRPTAGSAKPSATLKPPGNPGQGRHFKADPYANPFLVSGVGRNSNSNTDGYDYTSKNKEMMSPFAIEGKFSDSAMLADSNDIKHEVEAMDLRFRKPRFKQIVRSSTGNSKLSSKADKLNSALEQLMEKEYMGEEAEDLEEFKNEKASSSEPLKVPGLTCLLLPHQSHGVRFMSSRENSRKYARGGLLADHMGLGKTIQSIGLILNHPPAPDAEVKTTLVVVPLAVMSQWESEINSMAPKLTVTTHQGVRREKDVKELCSYDVVVTTYETVVSEHQKKGPLFRTEWYRIIADEAHTFRNTKTKSAQAMLALKSDGRRWALTGTPIHNSILDLYPIFAFIGVREFVSEEYFVNFTKPLTSKNRIEQDAQKVLRAIQRQLNIVMLRRTQRVLKNMLPQLEMEKKSVRLRQEELDIYAEHIPSRGKLVSGDLMRKLMRMRQSCNGLLTTSGDSVLGSTKKAHKDNAEDQKEPLATDKSPRKSKNSALPDLELTTAAEEEDDLLANMLEGLSINRNTSNNKDGDKDDEFLFHDNSKVRAVREILTTDRNRKTVIFSSFVTMLMVLRPMLEYEGIRFEMYHGDVRAAERQEVIRKFRDDKEGVTVLLCSLQTAAVGLNLTMASQVILVDPWWNPQIVDQAIMRVHRLGQKIAVKCIELYAEGLMEERMLQIQEKKRRLAKHLIDGSDKLDEQDKKYLFYGDIQ